MMSKPLLPNPKPVTHRDPKYRKFIRAKPCLVCKQKATFHHESGLGHSGGMSKKCSDYFGIPLCHSSDPMFSCHGDRENLGFKTFYAILGKDPHVIVRNYLIEYAQLQDNRVNVNRMIIDFLSNFIQEQRG